MGRPANPARRERRLVQATDYVLAHGLTGLSLRPLAAALGTSTRMLLYDFGTKEQLTAAVLAEARRREAALLADHLQATSAASAQLLRDIWVWISAPERGPFLRLFFEVYLDAMVHPQAYGDQGQAMVTEWLEPLNAAFTDASADPRDTATPTLLIAVIRGLLLDRLTATDPDRTDQAMTRFAELLGQ